MESSSSSQVLLAVRNSSQDYAFRELEQDEVSVLRIGSKPPLFVRNTNSTPYSATPSTPVDRFEANMTVISEQQRRAKRHRKRHLVPGPAGSWFLHFKKKGTDLTEEYKNSLLSQDSISATPVTAKKRQKKKKRKAAVASKSAWDLMCHSLHRIVPDFYGWKEQCSSIRQCVPLNYTLLFELLSDGTHDGLQVSLMVVSVEAVHCHGHCDWTVELADETTRFYDTISNTTRKRINGWVEERFVKNHPEWVRPGVVWLCQGASLAAFPIDDDQYDHSDNDDVYLDTENTTAAGEKKAVEKMVLIGESTVVYAWTPEDAALDLSDAMYLELLEKRSQLETTVLANNNTNNHGISADGKDTTAVNDMNANIRSKRTTYGNTDCIDLDTAAGLAPRIAQPTRTPKTNTVTPAATKSIFRKGLQQSQPSSSMQMTTPSTIDLTSAKRTLNRTSFRRDDDDNFGHSSSPAPLSAVRQSSPLDKNREHSATFVVATHVEPPTETPTDGNAKKTFAIVDNARPPAESTLQTRSAGAIRNPYSKHTISPTSSSTLRLQDEICSPTKHKSSITTTCLTDHDSASFDGVSVRNLKNDLGSMSLPIHDNVTLEGDDNNATVTIHTWKKNLVQQTAAMNETMFDNENRQTSCHASQPTKETFAKNSSSSLWTAFNDDDNVTMEAYDDDDDDDKSMETNKNDCVIDKAISLSLFDRKDNIQGKQQQQQLIPCTNVATNSTCHIHSTENMNDMLLLNKKDCSKDMDHVVVMDSLSYPNKIVSLFEDPFAFDGVDMDDFL